MINRTNNFRKPRHAALVVLLAVGFISSATAADKVAARTVTHTGARSGSILSNKVEKVEIPLSVFKDTTDRKDPFFPNASYRINDTTPERVDTGGEVILQQLKLTGFGGIGNKRWAMVNGVSIYQNESAKVQVGGKRYEITCLELKDNSVTLGIKDNPARYELKLDD